jgi:hypothetical protein
MSEPELIAGKTIYAIDADGRGFEIHLMVGKPYPHEHGDWACPLALEGLHGRFPDIRGVDSWQSLVLALKLSRNLLEYFVEDGGKLYWEKGGEEISVDELYGDVRETPEPELPLTEEQQARIDELTADHLRAIDEALLANASSQWRKVARVVGSVVSGNSDNIPKLPDIFFAERVRKLVAAGKLESQGNLNYMRFSEVRLPERRIS